MQHFAYGWPDWNSYVRTYVSSGRLNGPSRNNVQLACMHVLCLLAPCMTLSCLASRHILIVRFIYIVKSDGSIDDQTHPHMGGGWSSARREAAKMIRTRVWSSSQVFFLMNSLIVAAQVFLCQLMAALTMAVAGDFRDPSSFTTCSLWPHCMLRSTSKFCWSGKHFVPPAYI